MTCEKTVAKNWKLLDLIEFIPETCSEIKNYQLPIIK